MGVFDQLLGWLAGDTFRGVPGVPSLVAEHLWLSAVSIVAAVIAALPLAVWLGHIGRGGNLAINLANIFRAIPVFGLLLFTFTIAGFGTVPLIVVFATIGLAPIFTNAYVGIRSVDPEVRDAAEGLGLTGGQVLRRIELPIAMPIIMAGVRTSAVNIVATVPLAAVVGFDGLGRPILNGLQQGVTISAEARALVIGGGVLVALLAILTELLLGRVERRLTARGLRDRDDDPRKADPRITAVATPSKV